MRVIPVIDIRQGIAVHARRGDRDRYGPVQSCLAPSADPLVLLERLHAALGCQEVYVADLDALEETGDNLVLVAALVNHVGGVHLLVDAGLRSAADARRLLDIGGGRGALGFEHVGCSLDRRQRSVVWGTAASSIQSVDAVLTSLSASGIRSVIILEMDRIGAETGVDSHFLAPLIQCHQGIEILVGGGGRGLRDRLILRDIGAAGALVGTALHRGTISREDLAVLAREACHGPAQAGSW